MTYQLLKLTNACKAYGPKIVLNQVSLTINCGNRLAIVGENGVGKSTLARILSLQECPDSGKLEKREGLRIGYLPQEIVLDTPGQSIRSFVCDGWEKIRSRMEQIEMALAQDSVSIEATAAFMDQWELCHEQLEQSGGYDGEHRIEAVFEGLGLLNIDLERPFSHVSGGQRSRVAFARLLLTSPDMLVLDEPTNHLDSGALEWVEEHLATYQGAVVVVSHDRAFLNAVMNSIVELSSRTHALSLYTGNYDTFVSEKHRLMEMERHQYEEWKEEKRSLHQRIKAETFSTAKPRAPKDGNTLAFHAHGERHVRSQSRLLGQAKARLEELESQCLVNPVPKFCRGIDFRPLELGSAAAIEVHGLSMSYGDSRVLESLDFALHAGDRIVLQGDNGCGKTTLLRLLLQEVPPTSGVIKISPRAKIGSLDQHVERWPLEKTAEEVFSLSFGLSETALREELHQAGLADDGLFCKKIGALSLGQRKRLQLLFLMLSQCNVLLLDEPTNHLDLDTLAKMESALRSFRGAVLAVSHDRVFTKRVATEVWRLHDGQCHVN